jgi:WhiB family transcriptional regulator, redox-sensing transcriptional regulator
LQGAVISQRLFKADFGQGDWAEAMSSGWQQFSACRGKDPDIFYPRNEEEAAVAKRICARCIVSEACLQHAIANGERDGIWGGATGRERRRMIRQRRQIA